MSRQRLVDLALLDSQVLDHGTGEAAAVPGTACGIVKRDFPGELIDMALKGDDVHFITGGQWSMYQFLERALEVTGPAALWLSTYSITEMSARTLALLQDAGQITALHMLVDHRAKIRYPQVHQLAANIATRIRLTPVHAKVTVINGTKATIVMVGSANWTENPRLEAGVITVNPQIAAFHLGWLNTSLENGHPFS